MSEQHRYPAMRVPADVTQPIVLIDVEHDVPEQIREATVDPPNEIEFASFGRYGFLVALDEWGAVKHLPVNTRAISITRAATGYQATTPMFGDALFIGCATDSGDFAPLPSRVLACAGLVAGR